MRKLNGEVDAGGSMTGRSRVGARGHSQDSAEARGHSQNKAGTNVNRVRRVVGSSELDGNIAGGPLISTRGMAAGPRRKVYLQADAGKLIKLERGVYISPEHRILTGEAGLRLAIAAAAVARGGAVVVGKSAATLHGLATGTKSWQQQEAEPAELGYATKPAKPESAVGPRRVQHRRIPQAEFDRFWPLKWEYGEVKVSLPGETCAQIARWHTLDEAVVAAEDALNRRMMTLGELETACTQRGLGSKQTRYALNLITLWSESPRESELKLLMWRAGLPAPFQQVKITRNDGVFLGRVDFYYPGGLIVEYDGQGKHRLAVFDQHGDYQGEESIRAERQRERQLINEGFVFVRVDQSSFRDGSGVAAIRRQLKSVQWAPRDVSSCVVKPAGKAWKAAGDPGYQRR